MPCESQIKTRWIQSFVASEASPNSPVTCFFTKIACRERVKCKQGKCNLFLRAKRAHPLCYLFLMKIAWHKKTLNKSLFYLARVILYTFRNIHANLHTFILKCMIMHIFSRLIILNFLLDSRRIVYRHEHTSDRIFDSKWGKM